MPSDRLVAVGGRDEDARIDDERYCPNPSVSSSSTARPHSTRELPVSKSPNAVLRVDAFRGAGLTQRGARSASRAARLSSTPTVIRVTDTIVEEKTSPPEWAEGGTRAGLGFRTWSRIGHGRGGTAPYRTDRLDGRDRVLPDQRPCAPRADTLHHRPEESSSPPSPTVGQVACAPQVCRGEAERRCASRPRPTS